MGNVGIEAGRPFLVLSACIFLFGLTESPGIAFVKGYRSQSIHRQHFPGFLFWFLPYHPKPYTILYPKLWPGRMPHCPVESVGTRGTMPRRRRQGFEFRVWGLGLRVWGVCGLGS